LFPDMSGILEKLYSTDDEPNKINPLKNLRGFILNWNMIDLISLFVRFILENSTEFESQFSRSNITRIKCVFELRILGIFFCPRYQSYICFGCISFPMFISSYPESDIHPMFFRTIESNTSYESIGSPFENKSFKSFPCFDILNHLFYICDLLFIIR